MAHRSDSAAPVIKTADGCCMLCGAWVCDHLLLAEEALRAMGPPDILEPQVQQLGAGSFSERGSELPPPQLGYETPMRAIADERDPTARISP
eukprot:4123835-Prorocentrum_lima.AAC.1